MHKIIEHIKQTEADVDQKIAQKYKSLEKQKKNLEKSHSENIARLQEMYQQDKQHLYRELEKGKEEILSKAKQEREQQIKELEIQFAEKIELAVDLVINKILD